jgi:hypothetical protein
VEHRRPLVVLAVVFVVAASGCIAMVQGVGPVPGPAGEGRIRMAMAAGGGPERGVVQAVLGGGFEADDWFSADLSFVVNGVYQSTNEGLRAKQDLTMNWGLWPLVSGIFHMGPVDLRLSLFGIGGGGPEGPGGYMGHASGTLAVRFDEVRSLWAGFSAQAVFGCCEGEYDAVSYQVPVGLILERVSFGDGWSMLLGLEALWARETIDAVTADTITLLLHVLADWTDDS